jgi:hypothetical protein
MDAAQPTVATGPRKPFRLGRVLVGSSPTAHQCAAKDAAGPSIIGVALVLECRRLAGLLAVGGLLFLGSAATCFALGSQDHPAPVFSVTQPAGTGGAPLARLAQASDVNAPWADLLSTLPGASGTVEEPAKTGGTTTPADARPPSPEAEAPVVVPAPPVAVPPAMATIPSQTAGPGADEQTPVRGIEPAQVQPEAVSAERKLAASKSRGRKAKATGRAGVPRTHARQRHERHVGRVLMTHRGTARRRREVAPAPALQLPQGLIPRHATRRE